MAGIKSEMRRVKWELKLINWMLAIALVGVALLIAKVVIH